MPAIPTFEDSIAESIYTQKQGVFEAGRIPQLYREDFDGLSGWTCFAGTAAQQAGEAFHPGILRLTTGAASGDKAQAGRHDTASRLALWTPHVVAHTVVLRLSDTTNTRINVGFYGTGLASTRFGNNSIAFELDTGVGGYWSLRADTAGTPTVLASTVSAASNTWVQLDWFRTSATAIQFYVNGADQGSLSTNVPATTCGLGATLENLTAASRYVDLDLSMHELYVSQRY